MEVFHHFWIVTFSLWLLGVVVVGGFRGAQYGCFAALVLAPIWSVDGYDSSGFSMALIGMVSALCTAYGSNATGTSGAKPRRILIVVGAVISTPLLVSVGLELATYFSVFYHYRSELIAPGSTKWVQMVLTGSAALFIGQWHVGPAALAAWKRTVESNLRTIVFRRFNDAASASYVHQILPILGGMGTADLLLDKSVASIEGTGEPYVARLSDVKKARTFGDDEWLPVVRQFLGAAHVAVFVLLDSPRNALLTEMELAARMLDGRRVIVLLSTTAPAETRELVQTLGFQLILVKRNILLHHIFGLRLRGQLATAMLKSLAGGPPISIQTRS